MSDFSASTNEEKQVTEKNIVIENQSIAYNQFNRDFTKEKSNLSSVSERLFDESDDFDSDHSNENLANRLSSQVTRNKNKTIVSQAQKKAEFKKQYLSNTKDLNYNEVLSIKAIDVSPMLIKRNGKYVSTNNANKVDVMRINFQINNNENINTGYKELFIIIQKPDGTILNRKGTFNMNDGSELYYTEKTNAYYNNDRLNLSMMTDRFIQKITKGIYTITIYIEGYPVGLEMIKLI